MRFSDVCIGSYRATVDCSCVNKSELQKVTLEDVLAAAMTESKTSVVIYASERAMSEPVRPLPDSLEVSLNRLTFGLVI